jgi:hypothetical protein
MAKEDGEGWGVWRVLPRVAAGAVTLPVVATFVVLGGAVLVVRSVRTAAREVWTRLPHRTTTSAPPPRAEPEEEEHRPPRRSTG